MSQKDVKPTFYCSHCSVLTEDVYNEKQNYARHSRCHSTAEKIDTWNKK